MPQEYQPNIHFTHLSRVKMSHSSVPRSTLSSRQDLPSLSSILHLEPEQEPWCAGFAASQGRRCYVRTNSHGRRCAMTLLGEGTHSLRAGEDIDDILEGLAPYVLCTRFHQSQAPSLVASWRKKVQSAIRSISRPTREPLVSSRIRPVQPTGNVSSQSNPPRQNEQSYASNQRLSGSTSEVQPVRIRHRGLRVSLNGSNEGSEVTSHGPAIIRTRHLNVPLNGDSDGNENEVVLPTTRPRDIAAHRTVSHTRTSGTVQSHRTTRATNSERLPNSSAQVESRAQSLDSSRPRQSTTSSTPTAPRRIPVSQLITTSQKPSPASPPRSNEVIRKPITEPCPICLEELQESTDEREAHTTRRNVGSNNSGSSEAKSAQISPAERRIKLLEAIARKEAGKITYCKAYCGNNFHLGCVRNWLGTAPRPTCPMCRKMWKN